MFAGAEEEELHNEDEQEITQEDAWVVIRCAKAAEETCMQHGGSKARLLQAQRAFPGFCAACVEGARRCLRAALRSAAGCPGAHTQAQCVWCMPCIMECLHGPRANRGARCRRRPLAAATAQKQNAGGARPARRRPPLARAQLGAAATPGKPARACARRRRRPAARSSRRRAWCGSSSTRSTSL